jgi:ABC-type uncharacterized transport system substrate-binding protein
MTCRCMKYVFLFIVTAPLFAHPHVFIDNSFDFIFDDESLRGIEVTWVFDEMFSASIIMDYDANKNRIFEEKESQAVERGAFSNLKNYDYFLHIDIDGKNFTIKTVNDFTAEITDNRMVYHFFIPLKVGARPTYRVVDAGCWDRDYFCDVKYTNDPVKLENDSRIESSWKMLADKKSAYWGGFIIPNIVQLRFRSRNE